MKKNAKYSDKRAGKKKKAHAAKPKQQRQRQEAPAKKMARASLYGFHAVREAWLNETREIHGLYTTEAGLRSFEETISEAKAAGLSRPAPQIIDKQTLEKTLPDGAVHQGLALVAPIIGESPIQDFIIAAKDQPSMLVMLDQVTDPHNVGAILRSACVFDLNGMIMQRKHAPFLDGVLAKTACGAVEHVPVAYETNLSRALEELKEAGYFVFGLDERGENLSSLSELPKRIVLVMGAEGPGLRRLIKENCDQLLRLPTAGKLSSLNVSNAAAVTFYALKSIN